MSVAIKLVESLREQGVRFELAGDKVKFRGNRDLLTPDRIEALKQCKGEVVAFLRKDAPPTGQSAKYQSAQLAPIETNQHRSGHISNQPQTRGPVPDRVGVGGRPVTWTGKVVSLDEWRNLSEWERHGPNGKVWNGATQQWEQANDK